MLDTRGGRLRHRFSPVTRSSRFSCPGDHELQMCSDRTFRGVARLRSFVITCGHRRLTARLTGLPRSRARAVPHPGFTAAVACSRAVMSARGRGPVNRNARRAAGAPCAGSLSKRVSGQSAMAGAFSGPYTARCRRPAAPPLCPLMWLTATSTTCGSTPSST